MNIDEAYASISNYCADLNSRLEAQKEWVVRHPDYMTFAYRDDEKNYEEHGIMNYESTFDPADPMPSTSDMLTAEKFLSVMMLALHAYEGMSNVREKETD